MVRIEVFIIDKKGKEALFSPLIEHYAKSCKRFGELKVTELFNKHIAKAQEQGAKTAQKSYTQAFAPFIRKDGYHIALDPQGSQVDSYQFANLLKDRGSIYFYIGGAYGLEEGFLRQCDLVVSFGKITLSHKLIKVVLAEQIFRGLSILANHPYHK